MAFNVVFYTFSKKDNSTARPSAAGVTYACTLKDGCGVLSPTIKLNVGPAANTSAYNYCHIPAFGRYYFITDWMSDRGMWYASMTVDVLASWKTEIGATPLYVLRSSAEHDGRINDRMYPVLCDYQYAGLNAAGATPWWDLTDGGTFVVGLLSYTQTGDVNGGINYVGFNASMFDQFMALVFNVQDGIPGTAMEGSTNVIRSMFTGMTETQARNLAYIAENPFTDYIDSITWVPGLVPFMHAQTGLYLGPNYLNCGYWSFDKKTMYTFSHTFTNLPKHPKAAARGAYLNTSPYTEYQLLLPCYGVVKLDAAELISYSQLMVSLDIDLITGQALYRVTAGSAQAIHDIAQYYCSVGVGIKYGENKPLGSALQAMTGITSAVMAENVAGTIAGIANLVRERSAPGGSVKGTGGGYIGLATRSGGTTGFPVLEAIFYDVADNDLADLGAPLLKVRTPAAIPGYIQVEHGDISAPAMANELSDIKRYLEGGFFYE